MERHTSSLQLFLSLAAVRRSLTGPVFYIVTPSSSWSYAASCIIQSTFENVCTQTFCGNWSFRWQTSSLTGHFADCNCNYNWGTCIAPPTGRPRAHHRVNPYPGARRQNETEMFSDHDETSPRHFTDNTRQMNALGRRCCDLVILVSESSCQRTCVLAERPRSGSALWLCGRSIAAVTFWGWLFHDS